MPKIKRKGEIRVAEGDEVEGVELSKEVAREIELRVKKLEKGELKMLSPEESLAADEAGIQQADEILARAHAFLNKPKPPNIG